MSIKFIFGRAGSGKSHYCFEQIKDKIEMGESRRLILLVPEQFSFQSERNLLKTVGEKGIIKAEVLSFKRMAHRVFDQVGGVTHRRINEAGKCMLIHKIMQETKDEMKVFKRAIRQHGFMDIISETIKEFKRYNITSERLNEIAINIEEEELKNKISDLSTIYDSFENKLHDSYVDAEDELTLLERKIDECDIFSGAEIWIDEFSTFTPQQYIIIEKLLKKCKTVNITLCLDNLCEAGTVEYTDVFSVVKNTENRLLQIAADNNVAYDKPINLNKDKCERFKRAEEIQHLEKYFFSFPYKYYNQKPENLRLYRANNTYDEVEVVARDIIRLTRDEGYRFKDIAVVCRDLDSYENITAAIFREYGIPYFLDKKRDINSNPFIVFILSIFDIFIKNWSYESVFRYLKTGLCGISKEDIDIIENYVLANGVRGNRWLEDKYWNGSINYGIEEKELTQYQIDTINRVNDVRIKILDPLIKVQKSLTKESNVKSICVALYEFLLETNSLDTIEQWSNDFIEEGDPDRADECAQITDIVMKVLDQLVEVMGEEIVSIDKFVEIISIGFQKYEMGLIPASLDEVIVGNISRIRSHGVKAIYVIGVNDGVLPQATKEEGILSDSDRLILRENGIELAPDTKVKAFEEQYLVYTTLTTPSDYIMISYPMANFEGKALRASVIVSRIKKIFPKLIEESELTIKETKCTDIDLVTSPEATFNKMIESVRKRFDGEEIDSTWSDVYSWFESKNDWKMKVNNTFMGLKYDNNVKNISRDKIRELYGKSLNFSVSRLEQYAQCPFAYYIKYGLKAKDRKIYEFSPPDLGSFMHGVIDKFSIHMDENNMSWKDIDKNMCSEIVNSIVEEDLNSKATSILNSSSRYKHVVDRMKRTLTKSVTVISEHIKKSSFSPIASELVFGKGGDFDSIKLNISTGEEVQLIGRIDRVDSTELDGSTYLRIIDYKTGNKNFDLSEVYFGLQLQLLVYLDALISNSESYIKKQAMPGAILYFKVSDPMIKANQNMSDEQIEKEVMKKLKMNGLLLKDARVVKEMDNDIDGYSLIIPARMNKDGSLGKSSSLITMEQFDILRKYVRETIVSLCEEMLSGNIEIKPYKEKKNVACTYCSYGGVCQFDSSIKGNQYRYVNKKNDEEVWALMEESITDKETDERGEDIGGE